jgi:hypothetical protein
MINSHNQVDGEDDVDNECLDDDEELDPRVQDELERLNTCTDEINQVHIYVPPLK